MKTPHGCTWYAKSVVNGAEVWTRTQIPQVLWENRKAANVIATGGNLQADSASIYIPFSSGRYAMKAGDVLVKGLVTDTISAQFTISALKAKYPENITIRSIDMMDFGSSALQHVQIGGS